ncbi:MAG: energy-coupling factor transporter transmembrane component T family protein [Candidatus Hodarchaeota archaeon]
MALISFFVRKVYQGFIYRPDALHFHPLGGLGILGLQFFLLISSDPLILFSVLIFILLENIIYGNLLGVLNLLRAIFPLLLFLGTLAFLFGGPLQATFVVLRLLTGSITFSFFFAVTNPADLARVLEKMKIPPRWAIIPALSLTMVPRIAKDAEETVEALTFRGEIQGRLFLRWLPKVLAIFIASVLYRSEYLAQSLYYRGFEMWGQRRTHYRSVSLRWLDIFRLTYWVIFLLFLLNKQTFINYFVTVIGQWGI